VITGDSSRNRRRADVSTECLGWPRHIPTSSLWQAMRDPDTKSEKKRIKICGVTGCNLPWLVGSILVFMTLMADNLGWATIRFAMSRMPKRD